MLELKKITKNYKMGETKQKVLKGIDLYFRRKEFVSILGASGSGKTTLLNIIGGLDKYSSGDLLIEGVSTKKYKTEDWDAYRNNKIGFVFQNYNLISHQSVIANVELSLTLSGVSKKTRREKAKKALEKVGLGEHIHKLPKQLSGGQMQRVAIARAIVNDPEIILADEPTGALDSKTSVQIMNILKDISKNKLVIMVTHNGELAEEYSTRIIELKDGLIIKDSNPIKEDEKENINTSENKTKRNKTSMSFITSLGLSFKNLLNKKGRTVLVSIAGSIGIIGIALILSLSTGVQDVVDAKTTQFVASYPIELEETSSSIDFNSLTSVQTQKAKAEDGKVASTDDITQIIKPTEGYVVSKNNLEEFKKYIESNNEIKNIASEIRYDYGIDLQIYSNKNNEYTSTNLKITSNETPQEGEANAVASIDTKQSFKQISDNKETLENSYEILEGDFPKEDNEVVIITDKDRIINDSLLYALNIRDRSELTEITKKVANNEDIKLESKQYSYDDILNSKYKVIPNTDCYVYQNGIYQDKTNDKAYMKDIINKDGIDLKVVGILKPKDDKADSNIFGYKGSLVAKILEQNRKSDIAKAQLENHEIDVFTGEKFDGVVNTYDKNVTLLGIAPEEKPKKIAIYTDSAEDKNKVKEIINNYNEMQKSNNKEDLVITYTDTIETSMSLIKGMVTGISFVLIAFVAISLIVSSIMIAIITYISVLERITEIGILRAVGARKKDVSRVFKAETVIEGLISGGIGIIITLLLNLVINAIAKIQAPDLGANIANLSFIQALILIALSVILTLIAGLAPAKMASKKEPVEALRTE